MTAHNNVTDVSLAPTPAVTPTPAPVVTPMPMPADQTVIDPVPAGQNGAPGAVAGKKNYVVKKGDTLWGIAKTTYGDGKQYTRIVAANPGLSPSGLHVGQQIIIP